MLDWLKNIFGGSKESYGKTLIPGTDGCPQTLNAAGDVGFNASIYGNNNDLKQEYNFYGQEFRFPESVLKAILGSIGTDIANIQFDSESYLNNELPEPHALRSNLISRLKSSLASTHIMHLYGPVFCGKSVLASLLAISCDGRELFRLDSSDIPDTLLCEKVKGIARDDRDKVLVLDDFRTDRASTNKTLAYLKTICSEHIYIIIVSQASFSPFDAGSGITEEKCQPLTLEETKEMIPPEHSNKWGNHIHLFCGGQPMLVRLACRMMASRDWTLTKEDLYKLLSIRKDTDVKERVRSAMDIAITDDDDRRLIHRLMLFSTGFSRTDCRMIADIDPKISSPLSRLDRLSHSWMEEAKDGRQQVLDIIRNTIDADLGAQEHHDCCIAIVKAILERKSISEVDTVSIITMLSNCEEYSELAHMYTLFMYKLWNTGNDKVFKNSILPIIWVDVPLPEKMAPEDKILCRAIRLFNGGDIRNAPQSVADDLYGLLTVSILHNEVFLLACMELELYLIANNDFKRLNDINRIIRNIDLGSLDRNVISAIPENHWDELLILGLFNIKTPYQLLDWMAIYKDNGCPKTEYFIATLFDTFRTFSESLSEEAQFDAYQHIYSVAINEGKGFEDFASIATYYHIALLGGIDRIEEALSLADSRKELKECPSGKLLINGAIATWMPIDSDIETKCKFYEDALDSEAVRYLPIIALKYACFYADIIGDTNPERGLKAIQGVTRMPSITDSMSHIDRLAMHLSESYAAFRADDITTTIDRLTEAFRELISEKRNDDFKTWSINVSVLTHYLYAKLIIHQEDQTKAKPSYTSIFFTNKDWLKEYIPSRILSNLVIILRLMDYAGVENQSILEFARNLPSIGQEFGPATGITIFLNGIMPVIIEAGDWGLCEYIVTHFISDIEHGIFEERTESVKNLVLGFFVVATLQDAADAIRGKIRETPCSNMLLDMMKGHEFIADFVTELNKLNNSNDVNLQGSVSTAQIAHALKNFENLKSAEIIVLAYLLYQAIDTIGEWNSGSWILNKNIRSIMEYHVSQHKNDFRNSPTDLQYRFSKIPKDCEPKEYVRNLMRGFDFHIGGKTYTPEINSLLEY